MDGHVGCLAFGGQAFGDGLEHDILGRGRRFWA